MYTPVKYDKFTLQQLMESLGGIHREIQRERERALVYHRLSSDRKMSESAYLCSREKNYQLSHLYERADFIIKKIRQREDWLKTLFSKA